MFYYPFISEHGELSGKCNWIEKNRTSNGKRKNLSIAFFLYMICVPFFEFVREIWYNSELDLYQLGSISRCLFMITIKKNKDFLWKAYLSCLNQYVVKFLENFNEVKLNLIFEIIWSFKLKNKILNSSNKWTKISLIYFA